MSAAAAGESHAQAAARAQRAAAERVHGSPPPSTAQASPYAGLATRTIAFALDAALVNGVAIVVAAVVSLTIAVLHLPGGVKTAAVAIGAVAWVLWTIGYFATFWVTTGQTPGDRVMQIRVLDVLGRGPLPPRRAVVRFGALVLGAIPLGAGFVPVLVTERRRAFHDRVARTVVMHAAPDPHRPPG
jgi:uncharacterized RDD family membrane protein YckC